MFGDVVTRDSIVPAPGRLLGGDCPLLRNLRARDREEIAECGGMDAESIAAIIEGACVLSAVFLHEWRAVAVIAFHQVTPRALSISMLATEEWNAVALKVVRWGLKVAKPELLRLGYTRAECRTMAGHDDAIRLLEGLGFKRELTIEGYGASGRAFIQYAWSISNVPVSP